MCVKTLDSSHTVRGRHGVHSLRVRATRRIDVGSVDAARQGRKKERKRN